jgi:phosphopantothenoylcysteine decarboxylase/phosphopantothenate--cysteine ligase
MLQGKTILVGITGGIAAYKVCNLIRLFKKNGANVKIVLTDNALNFVTKLTLQTLSQNPVAVEQFDVEEYKPEHISLADEADLFVIAPASANTISKLATGVCDNLLTTIACAFKGPVILAPAMNCNMWENEIVEENLDKLKELGYKVLEPEEGFLACGYNGSGRLCEIEKIFDKTVEVLNNKKKLLNKKVVVTAGGTREKIDSVRYISNFSSGKMGKAIADEAYECGASVVLISTKEFRAPYEVKLVDTALEMQAAVEEEFKDADCLVMAAAVADYRAKNIADNKLKKTAEDTVSVEFVKNPDILQEISVKKKENQIVVGFCAESENLLEFAKEKIQKKGCDFLIANDISRSDIGFSSDYNEVYIIDKGLQSKKIERATKNQIAQSIIEEVWK